MGTREDQARRIIDANPFLTLATADVAGTPWASPVWFAHLDHRSFVWASKPHRRHSENIAVRPEVGLVVFDSTQVPGDVEAVYACGHAEQTDDPAHLAAFSDRSEAQGMSAWSRDRLTGDAPLRLFHVRATELWVLDDHDDRLPLTL